MVSPGFCSITWTHYGHTMISPLVHSKAGTDLVTTCYGPSVHRIAIDYIKDTEFRLGEAKVQHLSDVPKQTEQSKRSDAECIKNAPRKNLSALPIKIVTYVM